MTKALNDLAFVNAAHLAAGLGGREIDTGWIGCLLQPDRFTQILLAQIGEPHRVRVIGRLFP